MEEVIAFLKENVYIIMAAVGAVASIVLVADNFRGSDYTKHRKREIVILGFVSLLFGILLSNIANWFLFRDGMFAPEKNYNLWELFDRAGFTFYFGLFGFFGAMALIFGLLKYDLKKLFYYIVPAVPLFHGIARVGCAVHGCCYGITVNWHIGGLVIERVPTQFLESLFLFALFFFLQYGLKKGRTVVYFTSYAVFRFLIEFVRGDNRGVLIREIPLSPSQQIALAVIFVAAVWLVFDKLKNKKMLIKGICIAGIIVPYLLLTVLSFVFVGQRRAADTEDVAAAATELFTVMNARSAYDGQETEEEKALYCAKSVAEIKAYLVPASALAADRYTTLLSRTSDIVAASLEAGGTDGTATEFSVKSLDSIRFGGSYMNVTDSAYAVFTAVYDGTESECTVYFENRGGSWRVFYILASAN